MIYYYRVFIENRWYSSKIEAESFEKAAFAIKRFYHLEGKEATIEIREDKECE